MVDALDSLNLPTNLAVISVRQVYTMRVAAPQKNFDAAAALFWFLDVFSLSYDNNMTTIIDDGKIRSC